MRALACVVVAVAVGVAAERQWQTGTCVDIGIKRDVWTGDQANSRMAVVQPNQTRGRFAEVATFVIETDDTRLEIQDAAPIGPKTLDLKVGAPVRFAIVKNAVYISRSDGTEYRLRVVKTSPKKKT